MSHPTIVADALVVDDTWSPEQIAYYTTEIERRRGPIYHHQFTVKDQGGNVLSTNGVQPCAHVLSVLDRFGFPQELYGKTVLDIGCNAGFFSFAAKLRGARSVRGVEASPHFVHQAMLMRDILEVDVDFQQGDDESAFNTGDQFDVLINMGVIYHLQNPMLFLTRSAQLTREFMFLESEMLIDPAYSEHAWFIEHGYYGDPSNWWIFGPDCLTRMARAAGFARAEFRGFVARPDPGQKTPEGFDRQARGVVLCWK